MQERIKRIVGATLGIPLKRVGDDTSMQTCAVWDSLRHFDLILAIEAEFGVQFRMDAIPDLTSLPAICDELAAILDVPTVEETTFAPGIRRPEPRRKAS